MAKESAGNGRFWLPQTELKLFINYRGSVPGGLNQNIFRKRQTKRYQKRLYPPFLISLLGAGSLIFHNMPNPSN